MSLWRYSCIAYFLSRLRAVPSCQGGRAGESQLEKLNKNYPHAHCPQCISQIADSKLGCEASAYSWRLGLLRLSMPGGRPRKRPLLAPSSVELTPGGSHPDT